MWEAGECPINVVYDYCQDGDTFKCPLGMKIRQASTKARQSLDECEPCKAGESCDSSIPLSCKLGYTCLDATQDIKANPVHGGYVAEASDRNVIASGGWATPASTALQTPRDGFTCTVAGAENEAAACHPNKAGALGSRESALTDCTTGSFCPEATANASVAIPCAPGSKHPGTAASSQDDCAACSAGKFCAAGSTSEATCKNGFYCPARTIFEYEYPCPAGTSSAGSDSPQNAAACKGCAAGAYCPEGTATGSEKACPGGSYCPANSLFRFACAAGKYTQGGNK